MLIGGVLGYVFRERVEHTLRQEMRSSMALYGNRRDITMAWDMTQERLQCCGVDSWHDWNMYRLVPESCCMEIFGSQRQDCSLFPNINKPYSQGCLHVTSNFIREHAAIIGTAAITVAILMVSSKI